MVLMGDGHDLGRHERGRVQGVDGHPVGVELGGQVEGEQDLRELALPVGAHPVVVLGEHHVAEVDGLLPDGGDVDDPGRRGGAQQRQQQPGQRVRRQVVDGEPQLVPVRALLPRAAPGHVAADAGVVHQHVEPRLRRDDLAGELPHPGEARQVRLVPAHPVAGRRFVRLGGRRGDLLDRVRDPPGVAAVHEHRRPGPGQLGGQRPAKPVGGTGDKNDFPAEFGHSPTVPRQAPAAPQQETMACWSASLKEMT